MAAVTETSRDYPAERRFFCGMAIALILSVFLGFARSFYLKWFFPEWPAPQESFFLIHGLFFTGWVALLVAQTTFVAKGKFDCTARWAHGGWRWLPPSSFWGSWVH